MRSLGNLRSSIAIAPSPEAVVSTTSSRTSEDLTRSASSRSDRAARSHDRSGPGSEGMSRDSAVPFAAVSGEGAACAICGGAVEARQLPTGVMADTRVPPVCSEPCEGALIQHAAFSLDDRRLLAGIAWKGKGENRTPAITSVACCEHGVSLRTPFCPDCRAASASADLFSRRHRAIPLTQAETILPCRSCGGSTTMRSEQGEPVCQPCVTGPALRREGASK